MASEIRVDKINSLSGVGTVTLSPTGVDISGITTVQTLKVGSGVTASSDGDIFATGVCTATSFSGDGSSLTGIAATDNVRTGILDVAGVGTFRNDVNIPDKIIHLGDTDTAIRFPSADTITAETGGSERLRIDSSGRLLIGTTTEGADSGDDLTISNSGNMGLTLRSTDSNYCNIYFSDATSGTAEYAGYVSYQHSTDSLQFATASTERLRIASNGDLLYASSDRNYASWYHSPTNSSSNAATSSTEILTYGTAVIANTDVYNTSNGRYTAPVDGLYHIRANGLVDNNASAGGKQLLMYKNGSVYGSQIAYNTRLDADSSTRYQLLSGTGIMYMSAGDYAQIHASDGMHVSNETSLIVYLIRGTV